MKFKVGDKVRANNGVTGEVRELVEWTEDAPVRVDFTDGISCQFSHSGRRYLSASTDLHIKSITKINEETLTHLPPRFKLNPGSNKGLEDAMRKRLAELGFNPHYTYESYSWLRVADNHVWGNKSDTEFKDHTLLTLDDLYRLTPAPKELPKLEIAGRTLELKDGRVVGKEFDHKLQSFKDTLRGVLSQTIGKHYLGGRGVVAATFHIGCQTVTREDLERALEWAQEVSK